MSGAWMELLAEAWKTVTAGVLAGVIVAIVGQRREDDFSCAPADPEDDEDDTAAWDRGHDQWTDREAGIW